MNRYLAARNETDQIGAAPWSAEADGAALQAAVSADGAFLEQRFEDAEQGYVTAALGFESIAAGRDDALAGFIAEGLAAAHLLESGSSEADQARDL